MKITPIGNMVQLHIQVAEAGILDTSSLDTAVEFAEVLAVGDKVETLKPSEKVFVKAWAVDIINYKGEKYYFVDITSNGILAKVE